jgi:hypothetical protein
MADLTDIRLAIASQPTVEQSLHALVRALGSQFADAQASDDANAIDRVAEYLASNVKSLHDAVLANTPRAEETATLVTPVPDREADLAGQPSLGQGLVLFIRDINGRLADTGGDASQLGGLVDHLRDNADTIVDDVLKNTPLSQRDAALGTPVPAHVAGAFAGAPGAVDPPSENQTHVLDKHNTDTGETGVNPPPSQNPGFGANPEEGVHPGDRAQAAAAEAQGQPSAPPHGEGAGQPHEPANAPPHGEPTPDNPTPPVHPAA